MKAQRQNRRAFSLIELVIVIIIMGVISAIAIPRMMRGADNADVTALSADLSVLRGAIEMCRYEHAGFPADEVEFVSWLTTEVSGNGPYIIKIPPLKTGDNAGETAVKVIANDPPLAGDVAAGFGWLYNPTVGTIYANDALHLTD